MIKLIKYVVVIILCIALISGALLWYCSPILKPIPQPTGPYSVGITSLDLIDTSRAEIHAQDPSAKRELLVDLYYPSSAPQGVNYPYQASTINALKKIKPILPVPAWLWHRLLTGVKGYAAPNAPLALDKAPYPLLLFMPGIGNPGLYESYLHELASQGYVVAFIHPSYDMQAVGFPDGRIIEIDPELQKMVQANDRQKIYAYREIAHKVWVKDLMFVVDALTKLNADNSFLLHNAYNLDRIAALGHSHGGAAVIDFCRQDKRCKAGVNIDGWTKTESPTAVNKPFLTLVSGKYDFSKPLTGGATGFDTFVKNMKSNKDSSFIYFEDADHGAFSDLIFLKWPVGSLSGDPYAGRKNFIAPIEQFLKKYVR